LAQDPERLGKLFKLYQKCCSFHMICKHMGHWGHKKSLVDHESMSTSSQCCYHVVVSYNGITEMGCVGWLDDLTKHNVLVRGCHILMWPEVTWFWSWWGYSQPEAAIVCLQKRSLFFKATVKIIIWLGIGCQAWLKLLLPDTRYMKILHY